jgi:hypothetical protein
MGLRESLRDFFTMQEASAGAAQSTGALRDQLMQQERMKGLQQLSADIPGALESGNLNEIAGRAYGLGDPTFLNMALKQQGEMAKGAMKPGDEPMDAQTLVDTYGISPTQAQNIAQAGSRSAQVKEISTLSGAESKRAQASLARTAEERRLDEVNQKARVDFTNTVSKTLDPFRKEIKQLDELEQMDLGNTTAFWLAATNAIKTIGREAGALTDRDIGRPFPSTAIQNVNQLANWMGARDPSKTPIDPRTIKSIRDIISALKVKREQKFQERAKMEIEKNATSRRGRLVDAENKSFDPVIEQAANEAGLVAGFDDKGRFKVDSSVQRNKERLDPDLLKSSGPEISGLIQKLSPTDQAAALRKLEQYQNEGKKPPQAFIDRLKQLSGGK